MAPIQKKEPKKKIDSQASLMENQESLEESLKSINLEEKYVELAKQLAHNMKRYRDQAIQEIQAIMSSTVPMTDLNMLKLWKGLFYCMWMSDKRPIQQELAKRIAAIVLAPKDPKEGIRFCWGFWRTMAREWHGIDHLRLDKFYYFCRQMLFHGFLLLRKNTWSIDLVNQYSQVLKQWALNGNMREVPPALTYHVCEAILESLKLVTSEEMDAPILPNNAEICTTLLSPVIHILGQPGVSKIVYTKLRENFFEPLCTSEESFQLLVEPVIASLAKTCSDESVEECNRQRMHSLIKYMSTLIPSGEMLLKSVMETTDKPSNKRKSDNASAALPLKMKKRSRPQTTFVVEETVMLAAEPTVDKKPTPVEKKPTPVEKKPTPVDEKPTPVADKEELSEVIENSQTKLTKTRGISWSPENKVKNFDKKTPSISIKSAPISVAPMARAAPIKAMKMKKQKQDHSVLLSDVFEQLSQQKAAQPKGSSKRRNKKAGGAHQPINITKRRPVASDFM